MVNVSNFKKLASQAKWFGLFLLTLCVSSIANAEDIYMEEEKLVADSECADYIQGIEVYDLGTTLLVAYNYNCNGTTCEVSIQGLSSGYYVVKAWTVNEQFSENFYLP